MTADKSRPCSLGDIARAAGVSRMTASYALRNFPRVSDETRRRIREIAGKLGYIPDARIAENMARTRAAKAREPVPIAWLTLDVERDAWRKFRHLAPFREGAEERANELGYRIDEFYGRAPGMTLRRISDILFNRGIRGLIIAPSLLHGTERLRMDWDRFACISFEKAIWAPHMDRVVPDYHHNMLLALKMLRRSGYRRIGVLLSNHFERRSHHAYCSALSYFHSRISRKEHLKPLLFSVEQSDPSKTKAALDWLNKMKPDAIVCHHSGVPEWLHSLGFRVPEDIGVAHLGIEDDVKEWAGIWQRKREIGAETINQVISLLHNRQFGLPSVPRDIVVQGYWKAGRTLVSPKCS